MAVQFWEAVAMVVGWLVLGLLLVIAIGATVRVVRSGDPGPVPTLEGYDTRAPVP